MRKESQKYNHYHHGVGLAMVHLVFCPKRRKKVLVGEIRDRLFELWQALSSEKGWHIRALEIAPDHVHLFLEVKPTDPIHLVVKAFTVFLLITGYNSNPFHRCMDNSPIPQNL